MYCICRCMLPKFITNDFVVRNLYCSHPTSLTYIFFLILVFVKILLSLLHFVHNKIDQCSKCKKFRTFDNFKAVLWFLM